MTTTAPATELPGEPSSEDLDVPSVTARHFGLAVVALAMGGFAIGTTEFVTMGLLPQISAGVDVSIPLAALRSINPPRLMSPRPMNAMG